MRISAKGVAEISTKLKFRLGVLGDFPLTSSKLTDIFLRNEKKCRQLALLATLAIPL